MLRNVRDILNENAVGFKLTAWNSVRMCVEYAMKPHNLIYMDGGYKYFAEDKNTRSFIERAMSDLACETFSKFRVYFSEQRPLWAEEKWLTRYDEFMEELNSDFNEGLEDVKLHYFIYLRSEHRIMILYSADYDFFQEG